jgi:predicted PhzF superfamily epimerase YddE/YHI9
MTIPFRRVDVFAGQAFAGNPAGACLLEEWPAPSVMQRIAAEIDLCGHATPAAAAA